MKRTFAMGSLVIFGVSLALLVALTLFEDSLTGTSPAMERMITFLLLVLPAGIGAIAGMLSLSRREGQMWMAITGVLLNSLFALFHLAVLLFAG